METNEIETSPYAPPRAAVHAEQREEKQSRMGVASFVLAILVGVGSIGIIGFGAYLEMSDPGALESNDALALFVGMGVLSLVGALLLGLALGVAGLVQSRRKRTFAAIGTVLHGLMLVAAVLLVVLGVMLESNMS